MLANQWPDKKFAIASLKDRNPVQEEDDCVLLAAPDPQSALTCGAAQDLTVCMLFELQSLCMQRVSAACTNDAGLTQNTNDARHAGLAR